METPKLTPEEAFCQAAANVLPLSQITLILSAVESSGLPGISTHRWLSLSSAMRMMANDGPRPKDALSAIDEVIRDPAVRDRTRIFLAQLSAADPVDAVDDAELVHRLALARLAQIEREIHCGPRTVSDPN